MTLRVEVADLSLGSLDALEVDSLGAFVGSERPLGGLLGVESSNAIVRVPFLGDIPFIGSLFRHKSETTRKTDLIIQVTPHILGTGYSAQLPTRVIETQNKFMPQATPPVQQEGK